MAEKNIDEVVVEVKKLSDLVETATKNAEAKNKEATEAFNKSLSDFKEAQEKGLTDQMETLQKQMQAQYDEFVTKGTEKARQNIGEAPTINEAIVGSESLKGVTFTEQQENSMLIELRKTRSFKIDLPGVKTLTHTREVDVLTGTKSVTLAGNLTGDPVISYGPRQALFPSQKVNFRDLVPTLNTETGLYGFYRETAVANNFGVQQEGCLKAEQNFMFNEVKVVQNYIAGFTTFSKQLATSLPWFTTTLPRLMMRNFFMEENDYFYTTVKNAAATDTGSASQSRLGQLIDFVTSQQDLNFNVSYVIVNYATLGLLIDETLTKGYYPGAGGVVFNGQANGLTIMGVPIIGAAWADAGKALLIDSEYIERVQVRGLAMELSYENNDNFQRNQISARLECQEEINLMLSSSAVYATFTTPTP